MDNEPNYIEILIAKFLGGETSLSEETELNEWINASSQNKRIFEENKRIWDKSHAYFSSADINADREKISIEIDRRITKNRKTVGLNSWLYRVAAILVLPVMLGIGWYIGSNSISSEAQLCEVSAPKGQISKCVLSDGTQVWLNAGSTIKYNPIFIGKQREVLLDGEAYFIVSKNKHKPFVVTTGHAQIKVLGTVFNLKAYSADNIVETTLEEGSVEFCLKDGGAKPVELKPGEQIIYNVSAETMTVEKVETYLHTAWKDGKYVFKDADLQTIIKELERLYDVRIHLENDTLKHMRFRGMFEYEQNIFSALETLEHTTNMKYRMNGRDIWLQ